MTVRTVLNALRALTPLGWVLTVGLALTAVFIVLGGLGFRWDPLNLDRRRADRAVATAVVARAEAAARSAEADGQAGQVARVERVAGARRDLDTATTQSTLEARDAHDADQPLPGDRVARLRDHDRQLCRIAPDLVGCPAAPDPARPGEPPM